MTLTSLRALNGTYSLSNIVRRSPSIIAPKTPQRINLIECEESDDSLSVNTLRIEIPDTMDSGLLLQESSQGDSAFNFPQEEIIYSDLTDNDFETSTSESASQLSPLIIQPTSSVSSIRKKAINSQKVPTPDFYVPNKRKKNSDDEIQRSLDELTKTAIKAFDKIDECTNTQQSTTVDPYAQMIGCALQEIPKEKIFRCIGTIMTVLDIYARGRDVVIQEKGW